MASQYFAILTDYGTAAFAKALSSKQPLQLQTFAVGDGNGQAVTPTSNRTALVREKHRASVSAVSLDPRNNKQIIVELTIPENVGGFYIREMGVFDVNNKLIAYANCPESFKPTLASGSGKVQVMRMILLVASSNAVTLTVDDSVIFVTRGQLTPKTITANSANGFDHTGHSHAIDKASTTKAGIVQLSSANDSDDETKAATPKAVKVLKGLIDAIARNLTNYIPNSKKSSAVDSNSADTVATSVAVKTAFDRAVSAETNNRYQKIYVSNGALTLDLTNKQQVIDLFGDSYRINGHLSFSAHNNAQSNITGLPLTTKSPIAVTFYLIGGYSSVYCHYPILGRSFFSSVNFNNTTLTYKWIELLTNTGEQTINDQLVLATSGWSKIKFPIDNGGEWRFEINPNSKTDPRFSVVYKMLDGTHRYCSFPSLEKNEVVAYRSWVDSQIANNFARGELTTQNLNDIKAYGIYAQKANREATTERNYPTNFAGTLLVYPSAYNVMQQYIDFHAGETYQRNMNIDLRTWSEWRRIDGLNGVRKSGDTMTGNLTVPNLIVNDPTNNNNFVQIGDDTKLIDVDMGHTVGLQTTDNANDAYIAYGATKKRFGFDGNMFFADAALATNHIGHGSYAQQYNVAAPFYVHQTLSVARDTYHPFVKGRVRAAGQYGAAFSFGYTTNQNRGSDGYGTGVIHLISDAGAERLWRFGHNGEFASAGDVITSAGRSLNSAIYRDEGNPHDIAISWLSNGLKVRVDATDLGRVAFQQDIHNALRGAVCAFAMGHPPAGWLKCNGAAVSRTAYADLFSIIGTHYGAGDGHSTFNLPDLRGEFIRGIDEGRGADPNRAFGSWQSDEIRSHNHFIQFDGVAAGRRGAAEGAIHSGSGKPYYTDHTGGNETRPRNVALLYCIKY